MRRELPLAARPVAAALTAGAGTAAAAAITALPPGTGHGRLTVLGGEVLGSPTFWALLLFVSIAFLLVMEVLARATARRCSASVGDARLVWEPLAWGAGAPLLALLIDPWSFFASSGVLAAAGLGLGGLAAASRHCRRVTAPAAQAVGQGSGGAKASPPAGGDEAAPHAACGNGSGRAWQLGLAVAAAAIPIFIVAMGPLWWPVLSGDEPHYLLYAHSIVADGDIDLRANYNEGDYRGFYPADLPPHSKPGTDPDSRYSMHGIGLALLLAPWYGVGRDLSIASFTLLMRFSMLLWLAAFAVILFELVRDIGGETAARRGTLVAVLTGPLIFVAPHLFPDLPAMTLSAAAYLILLRSRTVLAALGAGLLIAYLPWLGVKFFAMVAAMAIAGAVMLWRSATGSRARVGAFLAPVVGSGLGHLAFTWVLYGRLSPLALYHGGSPTGTRGTGQSESLIDYVLDIEGALRTGVGLFLDQKHGLLMFAPHFLLAVAGFAWLWRRRRPAFWFLLTVFGAHWGAHALSQELGGWSTPGRPLVGALWTLAIPMAVALVMPAPAGRRGALFAATRGALVALGVALTVLLMAQPHLLYHDFGVRRSLLLSRYGAPGLPLWELFPQWVHIDEPQWAVSILWLLGAAALAVGLWRWGAGDDPEGGDPVAAPASERPRTGVRAAALATVLLAFALLLRGALVPTTALHRPHVYGAITVWSADGLVEEAWAETDGLWLRGRHAQALQVSSSRPVLELAVELSALVDSDAEIQFGRDHGSEAVAPGSPVVLRLVPRRGRRWQDERFYLLAVEASDGARPAELGIDAADRRLLGLYLRVLAAQNAR